MSGDLARIGNEELDTPGELVLSCGLRVSRLKAQLDRIEAALTPIHLPALKIRAENVASRWAAFTDDELKWIAEALDFDDEVYQRNLRHEIKAELERRQS